MLSIVRAPRSPPPLPATSDRTCVSVDLSGRQLGVAGILQASRWRAGGRRAGGLAGRRAATYGYKARAMDRMAYLVY